MDDNILPAGMTTVREASRRLGRSIEQVRRYLREGKLRGQRIGGQWFIDEADLPRAYFSPSPVLHTVRERAERVAPSAGLAARPAALLERIDSRRKAVRKRRGGDIPEDVVEALRAVREEH